MRSVVANHGPGSNPRRKLAVASYRRDVGRRPHGGGHRHIARGTRPRAAVPSAAHVAPSHRAKSGHDVAQPVRIPSPIQRVRSAAIISATICTEQRPPCAISTQPGAWLQPEITGKIWLFSYLCDPQWFRDTASRGPTTIAAPKPQFRTCPSDHGKAPSNIAP
ncbi:hypothetical protein F511_26552 [Dorcoceras hygrometricum]|uniref:Uncharacterized protein n=1 Tax=Dorcoceras hygrometricum TaxID=472368 RepID=A0A2Z7CE98_9LAMI|nr:hypothetical protein F511_26552 [Dorcoceras hygrometricum]